MKCNMIYRLITQSETRYLHDVIALSRVVGLNGLIVNAALDTSGVQTEVLNVYAAGRFSRDLDLTPGQVIHEFASLIATSQSAGTLTDVLKFVENLRSWEASIPEQFQLAPFASGFSNAKAAMEALLGKAERESAFTPTDNATGIYTAVENPVVPARRGRKIDGCPSSGN